MAAAASSRAWCNWEKSILIIYRPRMKVGNASEGLSDEPRRGRRERLEKTGASVYHGHSGVCRDQGGGMVAETAEGFTYHNWQSRGGDAPRRVQPASLSSATTTREGLSAVPGTAAAWSRGPRRPSPPTAVSKTAASTSSGMPSGKLNAVMPPNCMPVSSVATSRAAKDSRRALSSAFDRAVHVEPPRAQVDHRGIAFGAVALVAQDQVLAQSSRPKP